MSEPLKPCPFPFCNSANVGVHDGNPCYVACANCRAEGPVADTSNEAVARWNAAPRSGRLTEMDEEACQLVAKMHAAAVGYVGGPIRGVVEDVADLREKLEAAERLADQRLDACSVAEHIAESAEARVKELESLLSEEYHRNRELLDDWRRTAVEAQARVAQLEASAANHETVRLTLARLVGNETDAPALTLAAALEIMVDALRRRASDLERQVELRGA